MYGLIFDDAYVIRYFDEKNNFVFSSLFDFGCFYRKEITFPESSDVKSISKNVFTKKIAKVKEVPCGEENQMEVIDLYEEALSIDSNNAKILNCYSNYMLMFQRYEEIDKKIDNCLKLSPSNAQCLHNKENSFF